MGRLDLGVGLALMPGLLDELDGVVDLVDCLEVEPQTFWSETGDPAEPFRLVADEIALRRGRFGALLTHGVSAPVGGSRLPHEAVIELFAETTRLLGATLASEHLSFNEAEGPDGRFSSAFFLPPRQTPAGVVSAVAAVDVVRRRLDVPFSIETPVSYLRPRRDEMPDGEFVAAVAEGAGCGILLDLHNIWTNQRNGRQDVRSFVGQLPLDQVWEVHLAGGMERRGYWLDSHSGGLDPDLVALADEVLPALPELRAVVYEVMPEFVMGSGRHALRSDLEAVQRLVARASRRRRRVPITPAAGDPAPRPAPSDDVDDPDDGAARDGDPGMWEHVLASLAIGRAPAQGAALAEELAADPGIGLLRELVGAGRSGRIASSLPLTIGLLLCTRSTAQIDELIRRYAADVPPALWGSQEGRQFATWLHQRTDPSGLEHAALLLDVAGLDAIRLGRPQTIRLGVDPLALIHAVHARAVPDDLPQGAFAVTVGTDTSSPRDVASA